jgi:hypothetical protein
VNVVTNQLNAGSVGSHLSSGSEPMSADILVLTQSVKSIYSPSGSASIATRQAVRRPAECVSSSSLVCFIVVACSMSIAKLRLWKMSKSSGANWQSVSTFNVHL